jgi:three-Cys-motif partner protein
MTTDSLQTKQNVYAHSQAKLDFYKNYLAKYLIVLLNNQYTSKINIYDVFCGIGIYEDGNKGSPIIAMDIIKDLLEKFPNKDIILNINDKEKEKIDFVSNYIEDNYEDICKLNSFNLDASDMFKSVIDKVNSSGRNEKNLVFIDPYGYKEIYKNDIFNIMNSGNSEIIIFLPIAQMYRFSNVALIDDDNSSYRHLKRFIEDFFDKNNPIIRESKTQKQYAEYIKEAFSCEGCFSDSYMIQRDNKNYYALFFITSHIYGFEKIIETKWQLDDKCGEGFEQKQEQNLFSEIFVEDSKKDCFEDFRINMIDFLKEYKTNLDIYEFSLTKGFLPKHSNDILKDLSNNNKLEFDKKIRKNSFYINYNHYKNKDIKYKVRVIEQ